MYAHCSPGFSESRLIEADTRIVRRHKALSQCDILYHFFAGAWRRGEEWRRVFAVAVHLRGRFYRINLPMRRLAQRGQLYISEVVEVIYVDLVERPLVLMPLSRCRISIMQKALPS